MSIRTIILALAAILGIAAAACFADADTGEGDAVVARPGEAPEGEWPELALERAFPRLKFKLPLYLTHAGDGSEKLFVVEQSGKIRVFPNQADAEEAGVFLDLSHKIFMGHNEEGLLCVAFHPKYKENGSCYVYYSADKPRRSVLSRFTRSAKEPDKLDPTSERIILEVEQPWGNHNGSTILFGPDGFLYCSLGDGGAGGDPHNHGQNLKTLLGSILRIDVDREDKGKAYAIPPDNPFLGKEGARPEIWAWGLRNVWRMSFDSQNGVLWAADVGQNTWEEIDIIVKGGNYGWRLREGAHRYTNGEASAELIDPVAEYGRSLGVSVTGGYIYRGKRIEELEGAYLFADYASGRVWGLRYDAERKRVTALKELLKSSLNISSFGVDAENELYLTAFDGYVYRLKKVEKKTAE